MILKQDKIEQNSATAYERFSYSNVIPYLLVISLYALWTVFGLNGFRSDHLVLFTVVTLVYFFNHTGRKLVYAYGFIILYWFLFDSLRSFPNYEFNAIHIGELYHLEKQLFGIQTLEGLITANEFFGIHNSTFVDIYTSITYICWVPVPLIFGAYLFFTNRRITLVHFWFTFLLVCILGWIFQYSYPAAAPWYVEIYGPDDVFHKVPGNPGRLIEFDRYFGTNVFGRMYSLNANVYAAVPSLHCAFPVVQLFFAIKHKLKWWVPVFVVLALSTWFAAVYTNHHYIIDVLCGIATALLGITIYSLLQKTKVKTFLDNYGKWVS